MSPYSKRMGDADWLTPALARLREWYPELTAERGDDELRTLLREPRAEIGWRKYDTVQTNADLLRAGR